MPRFYFDWDEHVDRCGADLDDERAAQRYALRIAGEVIRDFVPDPQAPLSWRLDIRRADHSPLASVALELRPAVDARATPRPLRIA